MRSRSERLLSGVVLAGLLALGGPRAFAGDDAAAKFVVVVNEANPARSMGERSVAEVYLGRHLAWANHEPITIVLQEGDRALHEAFCSQVLGLTPEQLDARLLAARYKGAAEVRVVRASSDAVARATVTATPGAIAYLRAGAVNPPLRAVFSPGPRP